MSREPASSPSTPGAADAPRFDEAGQGLRGAAEQASPTDPEQDAVVGDEGKAVVQQTQSEIALARAGGPEEQHPLPTALRGPGDQAGVEDHDAGTTTAPVSAGSATVKRAPSTVPASFMRFSAQMRPL